jgi:hypothetical protein
MMSAAIAILLGAAIVLLGAGCRSVGPGVVTRDRLHYATAVAESWKEQLLLNIVKTRYAEAPTFLDVVSVVSGYSLETGVSLNGQISPEALRGDTFVGGGLSGRFTDRPTISYAPLTGERFARNLMAPVPLEMLLFMIEGGTPADFVLRLAAQSIEGHHNHGLYAGEFRPRDPQFAKLLQVLRGLQQAGAIETQFIRRNDHTETWLLFHAIDPSRTGLAEQMAALKTLLGVPVELDRVRVVFATLAREPGVVGIRTRSLLQVLFTLGAGVQIHPEHVTNGSAISVDSSEVPPGFTVHSRKERPEEPFAAVSYAGLWFWIDKGDLASKSTLAAVTILFKFLEGGPGQAPVLTIPAN